MPESPDFTKMTFAEIEAWQGEVRDVFAKWDHYARFLRSIAEATESRVLTPAQAKTVLLAYPEPWAVG